MSCRSVVLSCNVRDRVIQMMRGSTEYHRVVGSLSCLTGAIEQWDGSAFNFLSRAAGTATSTIAARASGWRIVLMRIGGDVLVRKLNYDVPKQDLRLNFSRLPAIPRSRFIISNVRQAG